MHLRHSLTALTLALAATATLAAACGGDDSEDADIDPSILGTEVPSPTPPAAGTQDVSVTATDFAFEPASPQITGGAQVTVTLTNSGEAPHTLNFYLDEGLRNRLGETGQVQPGQSGSFTFTAPESGGILYFRCQLHPSQMSGQVTTS